MHTLSNKLILASMAAALVLTGCVAPAPILDSKFGDAVNAAKAQQTLNPDASMNKVPTIGLDGTAADAVVDKYHKTFETPPASSNTFTIGVGTGSTSK